MCEKLATKILSDTSLLYNVLCMMLVTNIYWSIYLNSFDINLNFCQLKWKMI